MTTRPPAPPFKGVLRNVEARIRADLLRYADWFTEKFGIPDTTISRAAVNDGDFLASIRRGKRALTPRKYDEMIAFLDQAVQRAKDKAAADKTKRAEARAAMLSRDESADGRPVA